MFKTDSITKNFLNAHGQFVPGNTKTSVNRWLQNEDPTYLGFWIYLQPELSLLYANDNYNRDYLPQGLLLPDNKDTTEQALQQQADSIVGYLRRRNEHYRAAMMEEFQDGFIKIFKQAPWMIQKISGVDGLWKINPMNNFRTKDVVITLECLETIDLKMTYLLDLYRKSVWDATFHRWAVPDCQRYFIMDIVVAEIRTMQRPGNSEPYNIGTFHTYRCEYCEIDPFSDEPGYLNALSSFVENNTPATVKFKIKVGSVTELNNYGLLGAWLQDTKYAFERGKTFRDESFTQNTTQSKNTLNAESDNANIGNKVNRKTQDYFTIKGAANYSENVFNLQESNSTKLNRENDTLSVNSQNLNSISNNKLFLGNVYEQTPANALNTLQGIVNNPSSVARNLLTNAGVTDSIANVLTGRIELSSPELNLIKEIIGSIEYLTNTVQGSIFENQPIGNILNSIIDNKLQSNSIGNVNYNSPQNTTSIDESVELIKPVTNNEINPIQVVLNSSTPNIDKNLGNINFSLPSTNTQNPGSIILENNYNQQSIENNVELIAPAVNKNPLGNAELFSYIQNTNTVQNVELVAPSKSIQINENVGFIKPIVINNIDNKVELTGNKIENANIEPTIFFNLEKSKPMVENVNLTSAEIQKMVLGKVDFGITIDNNISFIGNVDLK